MDILTRDELNIEYPKSKAAFPARWEYLTLDILLVTVNIYLIM